MSPLSEKKKEYDRKYLQENYARIAVSLPKEIVDKFKAACAENGVSYNSVVREAVEKYIAENSQEN